MIVKNCLLFIWSFTLAITKAVLNFEDENFFSGTADLYDWSKHPCNRQCREGDAPRICRYVFVVEQYSTMSKACYNCPNNMADCLRSHCLPGDGNQKMVYTACHNDMIVVEVRNTMMSESTTIHWHGFKQKHTPYMDGVPFVTQCPIQPGETFQYIFNASQPGTYFWHSHIGTQRSDGLFGPLIILPYPSTNIHRSMYDVDVHRMIINDWMVPDGATALIKTYHQIADVIPTTIIINGLGRVEQRVQGNRRPSVLTAAFAVEKGKRYRFRLIDAGAEDCPIEMPCAIEMSIDQHPLQVISLDANDIEPIEVDAITLFPGERIDFVINPDKPINNYWIRYKGHGACAGLHQVTLLRYKGADNSTLYDPLSYKQKLDDKNIRYRAGSLQMNNINFMLPPFPVLSQPDMIEPKTFCNATWNLPKADCIKEQCSCTNLLRVDLNRVVELILVDEGQYEALNHAMHLHGFYFRVVAEEQLEGRVTIDRIKQLDRQGKIKRNLDRPPLKDTMKAPSNGFIIVRFFSDNPGYWFFHCHYEHHTSNGMALLFKVGEHSDFPPVPKNFPKCGWLSSSK
ncbi:unnamed protein product [Trichogramma brassicae]|uniref:Uncharacterized protein n=1 Tax=Trichogramma brassicae TaxID=86971 RepID=A0A6H5IDA4_9HYME|nr:unnamed protein product [Trichogramma brassicae]